MKKIMLLALTVLIISLNLKAVDNNINNINEEQNNNYSQIIKDKLYSICTTTTDVTKKIGLTAFSVANYCVKDIYDTTKDAITGTIKTGYDFCLGTGLGIYYGGKVGLDTSKKFAKLALYALAVFAAIYGIDYVMKLVSEHIVTLKPILGYKYGAFDSESTKFIKNSLQKITSLIPEKYISIFYSIKKKFAPAEYTGSKFNFNYTYKSIIAYSAITTLIQGLLYFISSASAEALIFLPIQFVLIILALSGFKIGEQLITGIKNIDFWNCFKNTFDQIKNITIDIPWNFLIKQNT